MPPKPSEHGQPGPGETGQQVSAAAPTGATSTSAQAAQGNAEVMGLLNKLRADMDRQQQESAKREDALRSELHALAPTSAADARQPMSLAGFSPRCGN